MQNVRPDAVIRRALRAQICPTCLQRPVGSESLPNTQARVCEGACTIFANLKTLMRIAAQQARAATAGQKLTATDQRLEGGMVSHFERAVQDEVCQTCTASPTAGDYCHQRLNCSCPLVLYGGRALAIIESLLPGVRRRHRAACGPRQQPQTLS